MRLALGLEERIAEGARALQALALGRTKDAEERMRPLDHAEARGVLLRSLRSGLRRRLDQVERTGQQVAECGVVRVGIDVIAEREEDPHPALARRLPQLLDERLLRGRHVQQQDDVVSVQ